MVNPTHSYPPTSEPGPFNLNRYARIGLHEKADGTFVNASPGSPLPVNIWGDGNGPVPVDPEHNALLTMGIEHYMVQNGKAYILNRQFSLASLASIDFMGVTTAASDIHFRRITVSSNIGPVQTYFYEGVTYSSPGTPEQAVNMNRTSVTTYTMDIYSAPTLTSTGLQLDSELTPSGGNKVGGSTSDLPVAWVLKPSTAYAIRIHNPANQTATITAGMFFYEP